MSHQPQSAPRNFFVEPRCRVTDEPELPILGTTVEIAPMYFTDEYPCEGLRLTINFSLSGAVTLCVYHPHKAAPLELYPCDDHAMLLKRVAEWVARHPAKASS